jgi:hypothetical protein
VPYLGIPYRLAYVSKNYVTGFTDIIAMVMLPSGAVVGPYPMTEFLGLGFSGVYGYDFQSDISFVEGEYLVSVISPMEAVRSLIRFTLEKRPPDPSQIIIQPEPGPVNIEIATDETIIQPSLASSLTVEDEKTQIELTPVETNINIEACRDT